MGSTGPMRPSGTTHMRIAPVMEAVQSELKNHPMLKDQLAFPGAVKTFEDGLAIMAAYVDLVLDGEYDGDDVVKIYEIIYKRLINKRGPVATIGKGKGR